MAMATTKVKTNSSVGELIAVAELKDLLLSINTKLDLLLNGKTALATTVTHCSQATLQDLGPESWTEAELKDWVNDLDGVTRYCVENGGMSAQEVWEARRAEEAMKTERW